MIQEVQELIKRYSNKMKVMGYSTKTIGVYVHFFTLFVKRHNIKRASLKDIDNFILSITGYSSKNQGINAIRFYFKYIEYSKLKLRRITRPRKQRKLPKVLDKSFILSGINSCTNKKHKCILLLLYGSGLRISELINLKITDIDSARHRIKINISKGNKDRYAIVSEATINELREYYRIFKPKDYLFNGQDSSMYSATSIREIVKQYLQTNPHALRHSFATHLIEDGVDISLVSKLLGHSKLETTMIYNHVTIDKVPFLV